MKWRNSKEREMLSSAGGSRDNTQTRTDSETNDYIQDINNSSDVNEDETSDEINNQNSNLQIVGTGQDILNRYPSRMSDSESDDEEIDVS